MVKLPVFLLTFIFVLQKPVFLEKWNILSNLLSVEFDQCLNLVKVKVAYPSLDFLVYFS